MYREAQKILGKGLSPFARILLGFFSALFGVVLIWLEYLSTNSQNPYAMYAFGFFCLSISFACIVKGAARKFIGRVIGAAVFLLSGWYLYSMVSTGAFLSGSRSEPSIINAIIFFVVFGLPGIWYAVFVKFPVSGESDEEKGPNK